MNGHDLVWCPLMHIEQGAAELARRIARSCFVWIELLPACTKVRQAVHRNET